MRDGAAVGLVVFAALRVATAEPAHDAYLYWSFDTADPYTGAYLGGPFLNYSPAVAQLLAPFHALPWRAFLGIWSAVILASGLFLLRPSALSLVLLPFVGADLWEGNLHVVFAAVLVAGFRWPQLWTVPIVTKLTPGIGTVWFLVQRDAGKWAFAVVPSVVLAGLSFLAAPDWWAGWFASLLRSASITDPWALAVPLWFRLPIAAGVAVYAARSERRWLLPVAVLLSLPAIRAGAVALLFAVPALLQEPLRAKE